MIYSRAAKHTSTPTASHDAYLLKMLYDNGEHGIIFYMLYEPKNQEFCQCEIWIVLDFNRGFCDCE